MDDQDRFIEKIKEIVREFQETSSFSKADLTEKIIDVSIPFADKRYNEGYSAGLDCVGIEA